MTEIKNSNLEIKEAIIRVVAFFDMFDCPLTLNEIWRNIKVKCELFEVMRELDNNISIIENKNGFYFLAGQEKNIKERLNRYNFTDRKFKRAMLVSKIFKFIPWIKMIAISNLLGAHNLKDDSDIDFFIVAENKRIWLVRFFCTSVAKILGLRPRIGNSRDKICLSFYVSEGTMDLSNLMLRQDSIASLCRQTPAPQNDNANDDIYFIYWLAGLTPLFDSGGIYEKLIGANSWLKNYLPNWRPMKPASQRKIKSFLSKFYHDTVDLFFSGLEPRLKTLQLKLLPLKLKNLMNQDSRVIINDQIIKLHVNDRREKYREKYLNKIYEIFI